MLKHEKEMNQKVYENLPAHRETIAKIQICYVSIRSPRSFSFKLRFTLMFISLQKFQIA